jgi:hypothetical protein
VLYATLSLVSDVVYVLSLKLSSTFRTFDTQLYTCAKKFDFTDMETITELCQTYLIPLSLVVIFRLVAI